MGHSECALHSVQSRRPAPPRHGPPQLALVGLPVAPGGSQLAAAKCWLYEFPLYVTCEREETKFSISWPAPSPRESDGAGRCWMSQEWKTAYLPAQGSFLNYLVTDSCVVPSSPRTTSLEDVPSSFHSVLLCGPGSRRDLNDNLLKTMPSLLMS